MNVKYQVESCEAKHWGVKWKIENSCLNAAWADLKCIQSRNRVEMTTACWAEIEMKCGISWHELCHKIENWEGSVNWLNWKFSDIEMQRWVELEVALPPSLSCCVTAPVTDSITSLQCAPHSFALGSYCTILHSALVRILYYQLAMCPVVHHISSLHCTLQCNTRLSHIAWHRLH